jgi:uncharacterized membrane protein
MTVKTFNIKTDWPGLLSVLLSIIVTTLAYTHLPEKIPVHWNIYGKVDGYAAKTFFSVYLMQLIAMAIYGLLGILPKIDPKKTNYEYFLSTCSLIKNALLIFLSGISFVTAMDSLGYHLPIGKLIISGVGVLFILTGNVMGKVKPNYFVGIRLPWTLNNDEVWRKTHRFSARIFVAQGFAIIASIFCPSLVMGVVFISSLISGSIVIVIYSYKVHSRIIMKS